MEILHTIHFVTQATNMVWLLRSEANRNDQLLDATESSALQTFRILNQY
jgi:hypothetical protein